MRASGGTEPSRRCHRRSNAAGARSIATVGRTIATFGRILTTNGSIVTALRHSTATLGRSIAANGRSITTGGSDHPSRWTDPCSPWMARRNRWSSQTGRLRAPKSAPAAPEPTCSEETEAPSIPTIPEGVGTEIVREILVCPSCSRRSAANPIGSPWTARLGGGRLIHATAWRPYQRWRSGLALQSGSLSPRAHKPPEPGCFMRPIRPYKQPLPASGFLRSKFLGIKGNRTLAGPSPWRRCVNVGYSVGAQCVNYPGDCGCWYEPICGFAANKVSVAAPMSFSALPELPAEVMDLSTLMDELADTEPSVLEE